MYYFNCILECHSVTRLRMGLHGSALVGAFLQCFWSNKGNMLHEAFSITELAAVTISEQS